MDLFARPGRGVGDRAGGLLRAWAVVIRALGGALIGVLLRSRDPGP